MLFVCTPYIQLVLHVRAIWNLNYIWNARCSCRLLGTSVCVLYCCKRRVHGLVRDGSATFNVCACKQKIKFRKAVGEILSNSPRLLQNQAKHSWDKSCLNKLSFVLRDEGCKILRSTWNTCNIYGNMHYGRSSALFQLLIYNICFELGRQCLKALPIKFMLYKI